MLSAQIDQTGKTVSEMLSELPDHDLEMSFDVSLPPGAEEKEPKKRGVLLSQDG